MDDGSLLKLATDRAGALKAGADRLVSLYSAFAVQKLMLGAAESDAVSNARSALLAALEQCVSDGIIADPLEAFAHEVADHLDPDFEVDVDDLDAVENAFVQENGEGEVEGMPNIEGCVLHKMSPRELLAIKKYKHSLVNQTRKNQSVSTERGCVQRLGRGRAEVSGAMVAAIHSAVATSANQFASDHLAAGSLAEVSTLGPRILGRFLSFERFV